METPNTTPKLRDTGRCTLTHGGTREDAAMRVLSMDAHPLDPPLMDLPREINRNQFLRKSPRPRNSFEKVAYYQPLTLFPDSLASAFAKADQLQSILTLLRFTAA